MGDMKSLRLLWACLAENPRYSEYVEKADVKSFLTRSENEGLSFLTQTLPSLGRALDVSFATGQFTQPNGLAPDFLRVALRRVEKNDPAAVDCVRQLTYAFYKLEVPYDNRVIEEFISAFIKTDSELPQTFDMHSSQSEIKKKAKALIGIVLSKGDPRFIRPCHGSGSTACRTPNHRKWATFNYDKKLDEVYSYDDHFFFSPTHLADELHVLQQAKESNRTARVCLVPKDSRGPRVISCEPAELMYIQQGLMRKLYGIIENHHLTRGYVNFTDQSINRYLARDASITGSRATIDMKEASDRVTLSLVRELFPSNWVECLEACRSEFTRLPDGQIVKLNKFAPMGSSVCFPVEALVFWALACAATSSTNDVYVYGDDIIVDAQKASSVMDVLESFGLLVNRNKSFVSGYFRESCGGDFFNGYEVTPVRVRKFLRSSCSSLVNDADLANNFIAKFGSDGASKVIRVIESLYALPFPRSELDLPGTIRDYRGAVNDVFYRRRWNTSLHRFEHRIPQLYTPLIERCESAWSELLRKELTRGISNNESQEVNYSRIESFSRPGYYADSQSARINWSWTWLGTMSHP
jgi:hypothetical protein